MGKGKGLEHFLDAITRMHAEPKEMGKATEDQFLLMEQLETIRDTTKQELDERVEQFVRDLKAEYEPVMKTQEKDIELLWAEILGDLSIPEEEHNELYSLNTSNGMVTRLSDPEEEKTVTPDDFMNYVLGKNSKKGSDSE